MPGLRRWVGGLLTQGHTRTGGVRSTAARAACSKQTYRLTPAGRRSPTASRSSLATDSPPVPCRSQRVVETERGVFLLRQFLHANLAQRVSTRPFLTLIEKVGGVTCAAC